MKKITILFTLFMLAFNPVSGQTTVFDFDTTSAVDKGDEIEQVVDGITMTLSGNPDLSLAPGNGLGGSSGDIAFTTNGGASSSVTIAFSKAVDVDSITPLEVSLRTMVYTLTPDGGGAAVMVSLTGGEPPGDLPVDLNWTNVTTITITSSTGDANFAFDDVSVSPTSYTPPIVFGFDSEDAGTGTVVDHGDHITETIDGISMTLGYVSDLAFGYNNYFEPLTSGNIIITALGTESLTFTFSEAVDVNSIVPLEGSLRSLVYTLTPDGENVEVEVPLTEGRPPGNVPFDLNWTNVTTITVTAGIGTSLFCCTAYVFDSISVNARGPVMSNDDYKSQKATIYPNPVENTLYIKNTPNLKSMTVYNNLGQRVLHSKKDIVDVSHLLKGMYFLQIQTSNGTETKRIIKK